MKIAKLVGILGLFASINAFAALQPGDVIYSQDFDSVPLGNGLTALPDGWTVDSGTVNIIGAPGNDPRPGHGHYLDMGSTANPATISFKVPTSQSGIYLLNYDLASKSGLDNEAILEIIGGTPDFTFLNPKFDFPFSPVTSETGSEYPNFLISFTTPTSVDFLGQTYPIDAGMLLDNIKISYFAPPVPEAPIYGCLLAGLGFILFQPFRRRTARTNAAG